MRKMAIAPFILAVFISPQELLAYNIHAAGKHHERMTWLSEKCFIEAEGFPEKCEVPPSAEDFDDISGSEFRQGQYWRHVRWPDDPTRQLDEFWTMAKFALTAKYACPSLVEEQGFFAGLTCGSHHGSLQFLHAMASSEGETDEETFDYIRGWSQFAYRVASGAVQAEQNYCEAVAENAGAAAAKLAPEGLSYCSERDVGGVVYPAWTVRTLFAFHCDKMFSSKTCDVISTADDPDLHKMAATGALLHLVQDSYSQAHAGRSEISRAGPYVSRVDCLPVQAFYFYGENEDTHSAADHAPKFSENCHGAATTIDPVTAGARLLYYLEQGKDAESLAVDLIIDGVLGRGVSHPPA